MKNDFSVSDILRMSKEESAECLRKFVYVATQKGGCNVIRDSLKLLGEKVHVAESGKVLVRATEGEKVDYPVYVYYDENSRMWEGTTVKPEVDVQLMFTDKQLGCNILAATAIGNPFALLAAVFLR